jgi:hypothetical protein
LRRRGDNAITNSDRDIGGAAIGENYDVIALLKSGRYS